MAEILRGTGVELRLRSRWPSDSQDPPTTDPKTGDVLVEVQAFAELEDDGRRYRVGGSVSGSYPVPLSEDPTTAPLAIARDGRETQLGTLLGDLRIGGCDVTRCEFYAAPFLIELADDVRERLAESWRGRPPR